MRMRQVFSSFAIFDGFGELRTLLDDLGFTFCDFLCVATALNPLQPISRPPCRKEIMYPHEWRIAIPASLMRIDQVVDLPDLGICFRVI